MPSRFAGALAGLVGFAVMIAGCSHHPSQPVTAASASQPAVSQPAATAAVGTTPQTPDPEPVANPEPPAPAAPVASAREGSEFTIPAGTRIRVRLARTLDTRRSHPGERFLAHLDEPIVIGDRVVVPKGTPVQGHVIAARPSGRLKGRAQLLLTLDALELHGERHTIVTAAYGQVSRSHRRRNLAIIGGGSGGGAAIGAAAGGGFGALVGAAAGAGTGTVGALITGRKNVVLPAETELLFRLRDPVRIRA